MVRNEFGSSELDLLRAEAEARLGACGAKVEDSAGCNSYELNLHRLELEMQDQSLQEARAETELLLRRLTEFNYHLEDLVGARTDQLELALRTAERNSHEKSRFLSNMSHELRTPLNAIMGMTGLATRLAADPEQKRYLEIVSRSLSDLHGIINDVLELSKIESGRIYLNETHFTLGILLEDVQALMIAKTSEKGLQLVFDLRPECTREVLAGDSLKLRQVLINLVGNAAKFTEKGSIHVRCMPIKRDDSELLIRFEIEDTGGGISNEDQNRLFIPFCQLEEATCMNEVGSGLGLVISRDLVTAMGGMIGVSSEIGKGSMFWFEIPLRIVSEPAGSAGQPDGPDPEESIRLGHAGRRILVVDDDPINQEILMILLERCRLRVDVAGTGRRALIAARAARYDLILMDLRMPEMDGFQASREIRVLPRYRETPIIALTADVFEEDRGRCLEAGMNAHLGKPVEPAGLFATILEWLSASAPTGPEAKADG